MKIKLFPSFALSLLFISILISNTESVTQKIQFQTKTTQIDTTKGTPNFSRWSTDGKIIFYFTPQKKSGYALWQLSLATLTPQIIAPTVASPVLNLNSKSVAFVKDQMLHIVEATTGKEIGVTLPKSTASSKYYPISWSPNSRFLALYITSGSGGAIWTYDIQARSFSKLAEINNNSPIAPDPTVYIYMTNETIVTRIFALGECGAALLVLLLIFILA